MVANNSISVPPLEDFVHFYNNTKIVTEECEDIYHYTSTSGLISILSNSELRFSDRNFMNDKSEGEYTRNLTVSILKNNEVELDSSFSKEVQKKLKEPRGDGFEVYSCSFSTNADNLCLWNYYSKDAASKGYNIHFKVDDLQGFINSKRNEKHVKVLGSRIFYELGKQKECIAKLLTGFNGYYLQHKSSITLEMTSSFIINKIIEQGIFFKNSCFQVENEYRIALMLYMDDTKSDKPAFFNLDNEKHFRDNNGFITPYVDIGFNRSDLVGVTISPTIEANAAIRGVKEITHMKYDNLDPKQIKVSNIPLRY